MTTTATPRRARIRTWTIIVVAIIAVGGLGAVIASNMRWNAFGGFDPDDPGPQGTRALARILSDQGIDVVVARDEDAARRALAGGDATLVLPDSPLLSDARLEALAGDAASVVIAEPRSRALRVLLDGAVGGYGPLEPVSPACTLPAAERAGAVVVGAGFTAPTAVGCYPIDDGYGLLWAEQGERTIAVVDGTELFTNERLAENGNAALAISLLGARERVVWFVPSLTDSDGAGAATLGELTPDWVTPAIVLLIAGAVSAAVWRGRRFGPLVHERLPVVVRGDETTRGRARLYERSRDQGHAADALRAATRRRLARALALGARSSAASIADAAAAASGVDRGDVRRLLTDADVADDRALVQLATDLAALEARVNPSPLRKEPE